MRLVLPTARSPTTLIFSFRRRIRKQSARRWPASKGLRAGYHALNSANGPLGRDRTGGNPSSALGGISFRTMDSGGAKITLDQESFKALASDVRVGILKHLDARRETVTDLSNLMTLSKPTLLEHLEKLQSAGLVKRVDEGRKWIYYELSDKGRKILHPERVAITLALGIAVALAAIGAFLALSAEAVFAPGSRLLNASAPSAERSVLSGPIGYAALAFGLAIASGLVALALRFIGQRRRDRFFEQLRAA
ncbi:MAG: metalloregulator ArsR/SmtB family transcription factor [Methanobacteriota archaeon]|nr:MAG: metalloregulator ArsR/SmtB family transcription factor [Euryarchaeota archaeon]